MAPRYARLLVRLGLLAAWLVAGCRPDLGASPTLVESPRILAVRAEPAESLPGEEVMYAALVASPDGTRTDVALTWAACVAPKSFGDPSIVSPECLGARGARPASDLGVIVHVTTPPEACALFGPEPPPGEYRPRDADATGGYFAPIRATLDGAVAFHLERVTCTPGDAPVDLARELARTYRRNVNPEIASVDVPDVTPSGARTQLSVTWRAEDAEPYVVFDRAAQALTTRRESLRVSWFATAGVFDEEHDGRGEDDPSTVVRNGWTAPATKGLVHVWIVLRDSRGGVTWAERALTVR